MAATQSKPELATWSLRREFIDRSSVESKQMACRWMWDKEIGRWLLPECMAVAHTWDLDSCTCPRPHNRLEQLEARIEELERKVSITNGVRQMNGDQQ